MSIVITLSILLASGQALADETNLSSIQIEQKPKVITSAYGQLFTLQAGSFSPEKLQISNGSYVFSYGDSESNGPSSFLAEFGWAPKIFDQNGAVYLEESLAFSIFHGGTSQLSDLPQLSGTSYSLYLFGFDTRLMYAATWFPLKILIPFVDGGFQYMVGYQPGSTGFESAQYGAGNFVASVGARRWLKRVESLAGAVPLFLTVKLNRIFPRDLDLDLGSTSILGGVSLGL